MMTKEVKQEQGEPVCDKDPRGCWSIRCQLGKKCKNTPQTKEWVKLTDENIFGIFGTYRGDPDYNHDQLLLDARRIEAKIKGLNT